MSLGEGGGPIIIQKKKKGHGGHHGGAWKVAYADFVTAMMALFIVLWILGQSQEVKSAVSGYFKDPAGFNLNKSKGVLNGKGPSIMDMNTKSEIDFKEKEKQKLALMGETISQELKQSPEFKDLQDQIKIEFVDEGLKIEIQDSYKDCFFEIGTSELKSEAKHLLERIGSELAKLQNNIMVEGHTDARPYSGNGVGYTNFELSAERANSARRALTMGGLKQTQVDEVRGYADKKLKNTQDPFDVTNRRISIIVKYIGSKNG
ncbi:MAG: flagellar motor protein MotB [Bacillota bacterium]